MSVGLSRMAPDLPWLPEPDDWVGQMQALSSGQPVNPVALSRLASSNLDFVRTAALDRAVMTARAQGWLASPPHACRLAMLGSATVSHLGAGIRVAGLRRFMDVEVYEGTYGQYWRDIFEEASSLAGFAPTAALLSLDPWHLTAGLPPDATPEQRDRALREMLEHIVHCWGGLQDRFHCQVIQQLPLPVFAPDLGANEHRLAASRADFLRRLGFALRELSDTHGVDLLSLDAAIEQDGCALWHNRALWMRAKQEISPVAAPAFGDRLVRLVTAKAGRSAKCLVLDLDNTLWGGEVGECGPEGIDLGQGSATGEAFLAVQHYALTLNARGVVLAVCSKNDADKAMAPFEIHPEMLLRAHHIASFRAGWGPKPDALREIAAELNLGLDALVFLDDSAFERGLVRAELPEVAVPELPDDPAFYPMRLADAGYFEGLTVTRDDRNRAASYQANRQRNELKATHTDLGAYLADLGMEMVWRPFAATDLNRLAQLSGRTNQFNLTGRRRDREAMQAVMDDPTMLGLQFRLRDRFGDNGLIAFAITRIDAPTCLYIENLQMSCRVLGRRVEEAILAVLMAQAQSLGLSALVGEYVPSTRNGLVGDLYPRLGFSQTSMTPDGGRLYTLTTDTCEHSHVPIRIQRADA